MPQQPPISFQIRTKNVLIMDGNEAMQKLRARVLRSRGVHVHTAKSVAEAELLWVPDFFDLVLLDVRQEIQRSSGVLENDSAPASTAADQFPGWTPNVSVSYLRRRGRGPRRGSCRRRAGARTPACRIRPYTPIAAKWRQ